MTLEDAIYDMLYVCVKFEKQILSNLKNFFIVLLTISAVNRNDQYHSWFKRILMDVVSLALGAIRLF